MPFASRTKTAPARGIGCAEAANLVGGFLPAGPWGGLSREQGFDAQARGAFLDPVVFCVDARQPAGSRGDLPVDRPSHVTGDPSCSTIKAVLISSIKSANGLRRIREQTGGYTTPDLRFEPERNV
jgi:hypothetical protein